MSEQNDSNKSGNNDSTQNNQVVLFKGISLVEKYNFYEYLSVMLDGGISITEALESVSSQLHSIYFKQRINELITFILSGDSFSKSMKKMPDVFSVQEISLVEAWETTGSLSESLMKLSENQKKVHNLKSKIKSALTYPMIIFLFLFLAIIVVLTYVVPAISPLFETADVALPVATQMLIATSDFIANNTGILFLFIVTSIIVFMWYKSTKNGKRRLESIIINTPLVGRIYKNYILSNIAALLGNLIGSGISVIKALTLVGRSTNNVAYEERFEEIIERVSRWEKIVDAMRAVDEEEDFFPRAFLQMLSVGEKTASLDSICGKINHQYEKEVDYSLANMTKWIEPLAILIAGIFVIWFAFAIFGAILKVTEVVG